jgi:hypothetical protein
MDFDFQIYGCVEIVFKSSIARHHWRKKAAAGVLFGCSLLDSGLTMKNRIVNI